MLEDEDYLIHDGVLGMKWGVWNAETRRKYANAGKGRKKFNGGSKVRDLAGRAGRSIGMTAKRVGSAGGNYIKAKGRSVGATAKKVGSAGGNYIKAKASDAYLQRKQEKQIRKDYNAARVSGMEKFKRVRKRTLSSHDPEVIERGMHTLTDLELDAKIARLDKEKVIREFATDSRDRKHDAAMKSLERDKKVEEVKKAKKERRGAGLGAQLIRTTYNATVNKAGSDLVNRLLGKLGNGRPSSVNRSSQQNSQAQGGSGRNTNRNTRYSVDTGQAVAVEILRVETVPSPDAKAVVKRSR